MVSKKGCSLSGNLDEKTDEVLNKREVNVDEVHNTNLHSPGVLNEQTWTIKDLVFAIQDTSLFTAGKIAPLRLLG